MSRFFVAVGVVVATDRLADALAALPDAEALEGEEAQSAEDGETELAVRLVRPDTGNLSSPRETFLFSEVSRVTTWLYRAGVPCRIASWGCQEESDEEHTGLH